MKGILPKPTLLELDEYDINQRVIEALTTTCSHAVLFSIVNVEKDVIEISNELDFVINHLQSSNKSGKIIFSRNSKVQNYR